MFESSTTCNRNKRTTLLEANCHHPTAQRAPSETELARIRAALAAPEREAGTSDSYSSEAHSHKHVGKLKGKAQGKGTLADHYDTKPECKSRF